MGSLILTTFKQIYHKRDRDRDSHGHSVKANKSRPQQTYEELGTSAGILDVLPNLRHVLL
jgi:hypothetical protein